MSDKAQKAMDKVRDEMAAQAKHQGIQQVGAYISDRLMREPELADKIAAKGKTLAEAFDAIRAYASAHRDGNFAYVAPEQAYELVNGYYGIAAQEAGEAQAPAEVAEAAQGAAVKDELDLDDLLGGL